MDDIREFFDSLDGEDAATLAMLFPAQTGNLNGVPFKHRTQANSVNVAATKYRMDRKIDELEDKIESMKAANRNSRIVGYLQRVRDEIDEIKEHKEERKDLYDGVLNGDRQLLQFDPEGDGKIAEIHGGITGDTQNVGTLVPGMGTDMNNFDTTKNRAQAFQDGDKSGELTMISWLGGDMPDGLTDATSSDYYEDGMAEDLADFSDAVRQEINHSNAADNNVDTTYAGHSYGGATVGAAEEHGLDADNVLHLSSAGLSDGVDSPDDLPYSQDDVDRYSITPDDDPIHGARKFWHGGNPDDELTRLESGDPHESDEASGHSGTLDDRGSKAWRNALKVFTGKGEQAPEYDPDKHALGGEYGTPRPPSSFGGPVPDGPHE